MTSKKKHAANDLRSYSKSHRKIGSHHAHRFQSGTRGIGREVMRNLRALDDDRFEAHLRKQERMMTDEDD